MAQGGDRGSTNLTTILPRAGADFAITGFLEATENPAENNAAPTVVPLDALRVYRDERIAGYSMAAEDEVRQASDERATAGAPCDTPTPDRLLASAMAFWQSAVLLSAHELGLFAALAAGPRDACTLGRCLGLRPGATADVLHALLALGLVERSDEQYRNAPEASLFLNPASPAYIGRWLVMASAALREMADLTTRLRAVSPDEVSAQEPAHPSLSDQMWTDIAALLRTARGQDEA